MELSVRLPSDFFVLPSPLYGAVDTYSYDDLDAPPSYDDPSGSSSAHMLTAYIQLKVSAAASSSYSLASLGAKLVASESLMHNNGAFEQSFPIEISSNTLRHACTLQPGCTYDFIAHIACPRNMPPSIQLPDARLKYKIRATAKVAPKAKGWFGLTKHLSAETEVTVVQQAPQEAFDFSHVKYVSIDGLGSTCISISPSPCKIGEPTHLCLSLPNKQARDSIEDVEMELVQQTEIRRRSKSHTYRQSKPTLVLKLQTLPSPIHTEHASEKQSQGADNVFESQIWLPKTDIQPTTLEGSSAVVHVSHRIQMRIHLSHQRTPFTCSWPVTVAHPHAVRSSTSDILPPYSPVTPLPSHSSPPLLHT